MKHRWVLGLRALIVLAAILLVVWQAAPGIAKQKGEAQATAASTGGASYLLLSPHTAEQCLAALDAMAALPNNKAELAQWDWGCMSGDHTGYRMVAAASDKEALALVPESVRGQAKAIKLTKFTVEQIESFHKMKH